MEVMGGFKGSIDDIAIYNRALSQDEITALPADVNVFHVEPLKVPGLDVERCMVWMKPETV